MTLRPTDPRVLRGELLDRIRDVIDELRDRAAGLKARVDGVESQLYHIDVLQTLPTEAPRGYVFMVPGDPNLYIGTGTGLRKVLTTIV